MRAKDLALSLLPVRKRFERISTYRNIRENRDIVTGQWRFIDLMKPPYSFPEPKLEIEENPREGKMIALWRIADLP